MLKPRENGTRNENALVRRATNTAKIIDDATFASVRQHLATFPINKSDDRLLDELRSILAMDGWLTPTRFAVLRALLLQLLFAHRFGSLMRAYQLIGYEVLPETRDPVRTEKGRFVRVRSPVSTEMD